MACNKLKGKEEPSGSGAADILKHLSNMRAARFLLLLMLSGLPHAMRGVTLNVTTEGTLEQVVNDSDEPSFRTLKIIGRLNATDICYLRTASGRIAGVDTLDLRDVTIVAGGRAYATLIEERVNGDEIDFYSYKFYSSDEPHKKISKGSSLLENGIIHNTYSITYYCNNLAGAFSKMNYGMVIMPKYICEVGAMTFYQCSNLRAVELPETVTEVDNFAFDECKKLVDINLPNVKNIGHGAFYDCDNLVDLDLSGVEKLGPFAFALCESFRGSPDCTLNLSSLDTIPNGAFYSNKKVTNVQFSSNLRYIGSSAFMYSGLISLDLPDGLDYIGRSAFYNSENLVSVKIPASVKGLGRTSFEATPFYNSLPLENNIIYLGTTALAYVKLNVTGTVTFRDGTTEIGDEFGVSTINSITFPSTLRRIGKKAFYQSKITNAMLPEGLEEIGEYAFSGCSEMETISMPSTLKKIGRSAFSECSRLVRPSLPESLEHIGMNAFSNCTLLGGEMTIPRNVKELGTGIFEGANMFRIVYNAENAVSIDDYGAIFDSERLSIGADVRALPDGMYKSCSTLEKVTFDERTDDKELAIGKDCFYGCGNITSVVLPKGAITIGSGAFGRSGLLTFESLGIVKSIYGGFYGTLLKSVTFRDGLEFIGASSFAGCDSLCSADLGNSVKYIGDYAFSSCSLLSDIKYGECLDSIGNSAFRECGSLSSFVFPNTLKKIGNLAF